MKDSIKLMLKILMPGIMQVQVIQRFVSLIIPRPVKERF